MRPFLSDLVLYERAADADLKFSAEIEKESILKQLFTNIQYSALIISTNRGCGVSIKWCKIDYS